MAVHFRILDFIDPAIRKRLLEDSRNIQIPANHQLIFESDWGEELYIVSSGILKARSLNLHGEEIVLSLIGAGDMVGDIALFAPEPIRSTDVVALTNCNLMKLRPANLREILNSQPDFSQLFIFMQCQRLTALNERLMRMNEDASTRLLATLLNLALLNGHGEDPCQPIPAISQQELAVIAGLSRGTTSTLINKYRANGTLTNSPEGLRFANLTALEKRHLLPFKKATHSRP